jgi:hypothetical protein
MHFFKHNYKRGKNEVPFRIIQNQHIKLNKTMEWRFLKSHGKLFSKRKEKMSMYNCAICDTQRCEHVINEAENSEIEINDLKAKLNTAYDDIKELKILNGKLRGLLADAGVDHEL